MINQRSLKAISEGHQPHGFLKPQYDTYSFSKIPGTVLSLLGCKEGGLPSDCVKPGPYDRVILFLIDGFGWKFLERYKDRYPFLKRFFDEGIVSKLTSQFPSTTAAHITTLCCNQPVGEHGIYEWFMYEPMMNRIVAPLLYTYAGEKKIGLLEAALKPSEFLPQGLFFKELQKHQIECRVLQQEAIANSIYSRQMFEGAERLGYKDWPHAMNLLKEHLHKPGLFYVYYGDFDTQAHRHGLFSPETEDVLDRCFNELEALLSASLPPSTALILTADHGMIEISPKTTVYLNQRFPTLEGKLKKGSNGHPLTPAGSCRDYFLHVQPQYIMEVFNELKAELKEIAWVCLTTELIERGFFGPVSDRCRSRMGDIAIIMKGTNSVWWYEEGRFEQNLYAMHGGLTPDEMETIFLFLG